MISMNEAEWVLIYWGSNFRISACRLLITRFLKAEFYRNPREGTFYIVIVFTITVFLTSASFGFAMLSNTPLQLSSLVLETCQYFFLSFI